jgi:hypothetical protein
MSQEDLLQSENVADEIIELSLSDLDVVGGVAGKCEASGTCDNNNN